MGGTLEKLHLFFSRACALCERARYIYICWGKVLRDFYRISKEIFDVKKSLKNIKKIVKYHSKKIDKVFLMW